MSQQLVPKNIIRCAAKREKYFYSEKNPLPPPPLLVKLLSYYVFQAHGLSFGEDCWHMWGVIQKYATAIMYAAVNGEHE